MDLFTYLLAKNGHNTSVHGDLFSYLLGKGQSQIYTISGTTIYIPNAKKLVSFMMTKESTQDGEPTPDNPVPVNVVEGYRNLFNKNNANIVNNIVVSYTGNSYSRSTAGAKVLYINIEPNTTYTISKVSSALFRAGTSKNIPANNVIITNLERNDAGTFITLTSGERDNYLGVSYFSNNDTLTEQEILDSIMIVEGTQQLPYVPYGNNYIAVNISDGTNINSIPLPLNGNEIAGKGNYLDEYIVDKNGHCWLEKNYLKYIFTGNEDFSKLGTTVHDVYQYSGIVDSTVIPPNNNSKIGMLSNYFIEDAVNNIYNFDVNGIGMTRTGQLDICLELSKEIDTVEKFKTYLQTLYQNGNPLELWYPLATPQLIDLNTTVDLKLFKGVNNISNSEDGYMTIEYR